MIPIAKCRDVACAVLVDNQASIMLLFVYYVFPMSTVRKIFHKLFYSNYTCICIKFNYLGHCS